MKKILFLSLALLLSVCAYAQKPKKSTAKADLKKAQTLLDKAVNELKTGASKTLDYTKIDQAWELLQNCMEDPITNGGVDTWSTAGRCQVFYMNKMLNDRTANNGQFADVNAFFDNQERIVSYFSKMDSISSLPPKFDGKHMPKFVNPEEAKKNHDYALMNAKAPRDNLLIAGNMLMEKNPKQAMHYLDVYFSTFDAPLFRECNYHETDTMQYDANLFYAMCLIPEAKTPADTAKIISYLEKAMPSKKNGQAVCIQIMQIYHDQGNMTKWAEMCRKGVAEYPEEPAFLTNLLNFEMNSQNWDEALKLADKLIANFPDKDYGYYQRGAIYYQQRNLDKAIQAFTEATQHSPESVDAWAGVGNSAWMLAQNNASNKELSKKYYAQAIEAYEHAHDIAPDREDIWGYPLYAIYNNTQNTAKAAQYKKYNK
ncbi:MAG: tetratricopeptide repeat protein [Bacteroidaceae bacterium]|nr:tetratricopeptide repeat protein [Bacteroidaceae bacterium]